MVFLVEVPLFFAVLFLVVAPLSAVFDAVFAEAFFALVAFLVFFSSASIDCASEVDDVEEAFARTSYYKRIS